MLRSRRAALCRLPFETSAKTLDDTRDFGDAQDAAGHEDDGETDYAGDDESDETAQDVRNIDDARDAPGREFGDGAERPAVRAADHPERSAGETGGGRGRRV